MSFSETQIAIAWRDALALWEAEVTLSAPQPLERQGKADWGGSEPLAYIDMVRRQVVVNYELLERIGAEKSLTAVYAHELGHHLRFPHTLGLSAALELLQKRLLPGSSSLTNLFFDLQVNEVVGRTRPDELCAVYAGFNRTLKGPASPMFAYYLAIYEELWGRREGELTIGSAGMMDEKFAGWRADARMFAQTFYALTDTYLQFVYFCSRIIRYLPEPGQELGQLPFAGDLPTPDLDDYAGALEGNGAVDRALQEGAYRGWLDSTQSTTGDDPLENLNKLTSTPGSAALPFRQALVARIYKRLVERYRVKLPATAREAPEPFLPTTTVAWEPGESLRSIDWTQSILSGGAMAALNPLRRELEPEPPSEDNLDGVAIEIYLDTSGSMPSPDSRVNTMTLAAQILSASAIRSGGRVRAVIYSSDFEASPWFLSEEKAREYLLHYSGGGTQFPFPELVRSAAERPDVLRVVISDSDFLYNVSNPPYLTKKQKSYIPLELLLDGIRRSKLFVALLSLYQGTEVKELASAMQLSNFRLERVSNAADLPQAAAKLAHAFWGK